MDISQGPQRHHRRTSSQFTITSDHLIRVTRKYGIVECLCHRRTEHRFIPDLTPGNHRFVIPVSLHFYSVFSLFQVDDQRRCRRQPQIIDVHQILPVYSQMILAGHFLSHIQHQGILPVFINLDFGRKGMDIPDLTLVAGCGSHIYRHRLSFTAVSLQTDLHGRRIEIRKTVVMPQQPVTFV